MREDRDRRGKKAVAGMQVQTVDLQKKESALTSKRKKEIAVREENKTGATTWVKTSCSKWEHFTSET